MPFEDKELEKLAQDVINRAVQRQTIVPPTAIQRLRASIKRQTKPLGVKGLYGNWTQPR